MIEYGSGQLYICQPGKEPHPIGEVKDMKIDETPYTHCDISPRTLRAVAVLDMRLILHKQEKTYSG